MVPDLVSKNFNRIDGILNKEFGLSAGEKLNIEKAKFKKNANKMSFRSKIAPLTADIVAKCAAGRPTLLS